MAAKLKKTLDPVLFYNKNDTHKLAIKTVTEKLTYSELNNLIEITADELNQNIKENNVALNIQDPIKFIIIFWALARLGKQIYLLNYNNNNSNTSLLSYFKINYVLDDSYVINNKLNIYSKETRESKIKFSRIAIFTSGSSATPKCVIHSMRTLQISAKHVSKACKFIEGSKWLLNLPLFHVSGLGIMFRTFLAGNQLLIGKPKEFNDITHISCVEKQLKNIIKNNLVVKTCILIGGGEVSTLLVKEAISKGLPIYRTYGLTESGSAVTISKTTKSNCHTSGKCLPHCKIKIKNNVIYIKTKSAGLYYLKKNNFKKRILTSWIKTNDFGSIKDNQVIVSGRSDKTIILNGENISCEQIEKIIKSHCDIKEAKVIGLKFKNIINLHAFIKTNKITTSIVNELNKLIKRELSSLYVPKEFHMLPKTKNIKYSYNDLEAIAKDIFN